MTYLTDGSQRSALNALFDDDYPKNPPPRLTPIVVLPMGVLLSIVAKAIYRGVAPSQDGNHPTQFFFSTSFDSFPRSLPWARAMAIH
ncbi:hypothetical protein [Paracoccus sediminicola]|uniref:hypothetical protein n=1 Tax=Paracoccus sediminicola TaxID=3017783 RepID=UPI0022F02318|nr:hypothetical protein [Paracoccus sediminicola]WBU58605.1 hypothetical protein PAF18_16325 [Paracoccus sediminicola]